MTAAVRAGWMLLLVLLVSSAVGIQQGAAQDTTQVLTDLGRYRDTLDTFQPQPYSLRPFILPGSETIRVGTTRLDTSEYKIDARHGRLWVHREDLVEARDTLIATYRTYPFTFEEVYRRRAPDTAAAADTVAVVEEERAGAERFDPFEGLDIERSGSISRGLVGGTHRDVNVESGLRMQLQGEVADSVHVRALLTDENTPIQPEGTTQRLQDFDRVFLEVDAPQGTARLGDVDVDLSDGTYGQFTQKVQGAELSSADLGTSMGLSQGEATMFGAVSRGQYRTQDLTPIDGVQGPYRLTGENGEETILVIAGSERVYLDGERLTRGRTNDYVIDYTRGEITFTSNRLITDDRRITVEFQYSTTQFTRTLLGGHASAGGWQGEDGESRVTFGATVIRQADGNDFPAAFDLSPQDSLRLVQAGDGSAVRSGARRVEFDADAPFVQYRREEVTTPGGNQDTIFVALDDPPSAETPVFRVRFTRVGQGEGRYERVGREVNGILYEYQGPGEGAYEPVQPLPAPTQKRLMDFTGSVEPIEGLEVFGEWAGSYNDQNRFSSLDAQDDRGTAYRAGVQLTSQSLDVGDVQMGSVSGHLRRRHRGPTFTTFDQTRPIEYGRRWNLSRSGSGLPSRLQGRGGETIDEGHLTFDWGSGSTVEADVGRLTVGSAFQAWRQQGRVSVQEEGWPRLTMQAEHLTSRDRPGEIDGTWLRQQGTIRQPLMERSLEPRVEVEHERRRQRAAGTDSLTNESFQFVELRPGLSYQSGPLETGGHIEYRTEDGPDDGQFRKAATAWTAETEIAFDPTAPYQVSARGGYRVRDVTNAPRFEDRRRETESILLHLRGRTRPLDRALDAQVFYDAATERTPVLQEVFVRTGPELGQYVWHDDNEDGVQQVDEFVPETTPNEGEYVQRFVPSDTLESVVNLQARTQIGLHPRQLWTTADSWWKQGVSQVTSETTLDVQEKSRTDQVGQIYRLSPKHLRQPGTTLDGSLRLEQRIELFRPRRRYGIDLTWSQVRGLTERAAGTNRQFVNRWTAEGRLQPSPGWGITITGTTERDRAESEAFANTRSYDIHTREARPSVSYQPTGTVEVTLAGSYAIKKEKGQGRQAEIVKLPMEVAWSRADRLRLTANAELAQVDLTGSAVGRAQFELTDGRGPGTSLLWGLQGRYAFSRTLRATVNYDGRAPATAPTIHTLRVQLNATF